MNFIPALWLNLTYVEKVCRNPEVKICNKNSTDVV